MDDMYRGMWLVGPNDITNVSVNVFQQATIGLELLDPMSIGTQDHNGNEWYGNYTGGFGGFIAGPNPALTASSSRFIIDTLDEAPCVLKPCPIGPMAVSGNQWFEHDDGVGKSCIALDDPDFPIADTLAALVRSELNFSDSGVEYFATQCPWLGGRSLVLGQILFHMISDSTWSNTPYECIEMGNAGSGENARKEERNTAFHTVVYPNPASGYIYIDLPSGFAEVRIYDALGRLKMIESTSGKRISLDVQSLPQVFILSLSCRIM
ncbi:MAG: T9SS type A sorting domain-containing protein [Saprospiraceae bacterium]|nr:T9SS type A sorting domain-containing protein [Saprospiraceae bacterium]